MSAQLLKQKIFIETLIPVRDRLLRLLRSPNEFFIENQRNNSFFRMAFKDSLLVWSGLTIILFMITVINVAKIKMSNLAFSSLTGVPQTTNNYLPWSQLGFLIFWVSFPLFLGAIRHFFIFLLGEKTRSFQKTQGLALYAALPFGITTGISAIITAIFPCMPKIGGGFFSCPMLIVASLLILTGGIVEITLWVKGGRQIYQQNTGRAILTYISPIMMFLFFIFILYVLSIILAIWFGTK